MKSTVLNRPEPAKDVTAEGALTPDFLKDLREGYVMGREDRALHNAVTNNPIDSLALNRDAVRGEDGHFSHRIKREGVTDQKQSGRCWMFAGLNTLRPQVMREHRMESFEFSTAYLQFWDKMEKSNLYLESVIELRDADFLDRDWELVNRHGVEEGGWWNFLVGLIGKYGVVPLAAMPETKSSSETKTLNEILGRMLRRGAARIMALHADGADTAALRGEKAVAMKGVYRFLTINLGQPPEEFEWRYRIRKGAPKSADAEAEEMRHVEDDGLSAPEIHTPRSFYEKYVGTSLGDYVCLYNDPHNEMGRHYRFDRARNIVGEECMDFVNVGSETMKEVAKASILANEPLWFAVNMGIDQSTEHGLMAPDLFDYGGLFGIDLTITKAERTRFHAGASSHAMALIGVDLAADGTPRKWLVENSWGEGKGRKGLWTLRDGWFAEHVYTVIAHQRHVPAEVLKSFGDEATVLPAWYPGACGVL
jgi:bleomycin hydrolase